MARIKKTATARHEPTLSTAVAEFTKATTSIPLHRIREHLASFPRHWPFPRGDLYHWINVLNRFDRILELFVEEYDLSKGPQIEAFGRRLLLKGDDEGSSTGQPGPSDEDLDKLGFTQEGDRELVESIVSFTRMLLENCGNRNLYSSSSRLNSLLNTTSLSLLKATLRLTLRLAQRYHATRTRMQSNSLQNPILASHYALNLDNLHHMASTFPKGNSSLSSNSPATKGKDKEKPAGAERSNTSRSNPANLVAIAKSDDWRAFIQDYGGVELSYYEKEPHPTSPNAPGEEASTQAPPSPTPIRRTSNLSSNQSARPSRPTATDHATASNSTTSSKPDSATSSGLKVLEIPQSKLTIKDTHDLLKESLANMPEEYQFDLLHRVRVACALFSTKSAREDIVAIRLLAIANLAYVYPESIFQQKISQPDSDEPRRFQLAYQLAELIQANGQGEEGVSRELQTFALMTLETLSIHKSKGPDVVAALSVNVNHGVLFYVLRKVVAQLAVDEPVDASSLNDEYRDALFGLMLALPGAQPRTGENMVSAGILDILVEILTLRTQRAEYAYTRVLDFLNMYVYHIRDAFQALVNAKGLDAVASLISFEVESAFTRAKNGEGIPEAHKTQFTDYKIPWHQQQILRHLTKFLNHMLSHTSTNFDRMLRNLIDSPQLLGALRTIIENGRVFGSLIWTSCVTIMTNFIHHEPTSFAVIAEAGLNKAFLEAITRKPLAEGRGASVPSPSAARSTGDGQTAAENMDTSEVIPSSSGGQEAPVNGQLRSELVIQSREESNAAGILPNADAIQVIPTAFGAICLNESGMESFQRSGALEAFFEIFESPSHIKALDGETDAAAAIGATFDELVRHHPALKPAVLESVRDLVKRIGALCFRRVLSKGVGTKLLIEGDNGEAVVAGGQSALLGDWDQSYKELYQADVLSSLPKEDVDMEDVKRTESGSQANQSSNAIAESEDKASGPTTSQYISVVCQFLGGVFTNASLCSAFAESDAIEYLLDFTTIPSLPYNTNDDVSGNLVVELERVVQPLVEQKPHLILPSLLKRAQKAVDTLEPFLEHEDQEPFFAPLTLSDSRDAAGAESRIASGTKFAKALVSIHVICSLLSFAFQGQMFNQRTTHNIFSQVNLADKYAELIYGLGRLHRSCLWEEILLQKKMPKAWERLSRFKGLSWGTDSSDDIPALVNSDVSPNGEVEDSAGEGQPSEQPNPASTGSEDERADEVDQSSVYYKNTVVLRFLLNKVPASVHPLIQNLGRILLLRRSLDSYHKQCSFIVAHQIAKACLDQLTFSPPKYTESARDRYLYWIEMFNSITRLLIDDSMDRGHLMVLTLILDCFKKQGGFDVIEEILESFTSEISSGMAIETEAKPPHETQTMLGLEYAGVKVILEFYSQVINQKFVNEANQTTAMQSRPDRDRDKPDFFLAAQFLVELRSIVLKPVQRIWHSDIIDKASTSIVTNLIESLKIILEGEGEQGAFRRSDKVPKRNKAPIRAWKPRSEEHIKRLQDEGADEAAAREALYRCYDNLNYAREYSSNLKNNPRATRNPIPQYEVEAEERSRERQSESVPPTAEVNSSSDVAETSAQSDIADHPVDVQELADSSSAAPNTEDVPMLISHPSAADSSVRAIFPGPSLFVDRNNEADLPAVTVDDLEEERSKLRQSLIDRALEVLNVQRDVTFELSDLITSASSKASDSTGFRSEVGATLVQFLVSLQSNEDIRPNGNRIAAAAHLLALLLQHKSFYDATVEELKENFSTLLEFVKVVPPPGSEEPLPWIGFVLLIMEKLLAEDCEPAQIQWSPPSNNDEAIPEPPVAALPEPVVSMERKDQLFNAIVEILPRIGKDESLGLCVTRILTILTRYREIATRLSEKRNIQRLFLMIKQLAGRVTDRLQASFMLVLRHVVEDEETIRNIMRSEIQAAFESRDRRQLDTTAYVRSLYYVALRAPEIFVEVTNEKLTLQRYEPSLRPQHLALKKGEEKADADGAADGSAPVGEGGAPKATEDAEKAQSSIEEKGQDLMDKSKFADTKHPIVEHPDGVIHYLLCELLAYKDVEDKEPPRMAQEKSKEPTSGDVEMTNGEASSASSTSAQSTEGSEPKKPEKPEFKADEHPFFMYRCFILQCLTELLPCYNRTKIEFINFSRKSDPHATTPSKPRSGVLNYLLNNLVPVNTLNHAEDIAFRKRYATSTWAVSVIVSLCSRTEEKGFVRDRQGKEAEDEPELTYVRRFVLEHALKAFKDASTSNESLDVKYSRLMNLADLFSRILQGRQLSSPNNNNSQLHSDIAAASKDHLGRIMYEKNFIPALSSAIADIDLNFPNAKRAVKYILRPLTSLTSVAVELSVNGSIDSLQVDDDDISSAESSVSDADDREQTPDLFRNSTLAMFEPGREEESDSDASDDDDDDGDEMFDGEYDEEYGEEMDYENEMDHDGDDVISEPDEELEDIDQGIPEVGMNVELQIEPGDIDDDDDDDDDDDEEDMDEDEDETTEEDEDDEDDIMEEISAEEDGSDEGDDEDEWSDEAEEYAGQDEIEDDEPHNHEGALDRLARALTVPVDPEVLRLDEGDLIEMDQEFLEDDIQEEEGTMDVQTILNQITDSVLGEEDDDGYGEGFYYDPEEDDDEDGPGLNIPWESATATHRHHHHHHHHHLPPGARHNPWLPLHERSLPAPNYRSHRGGVAPRGADDGINPLLRRSGRSSALPGGSEPVRTTLMTDFIHSFDPTRPPPVSLITNLINAFGNSRSIGGAVRVQFGQDTLSSHWTIDVPPFAGALYPTRLGRGAQEGASRASRDDPVQAVAFTLATTATRWQDEARLLFAMNATQRAERLINSILRLLVPPAIEAAKQKEKELAEKQARKAKEEQETREREQKEREEREAREKKEREEREAAEAEAAAARAREQAEAGEAQETGTGGEASSAQAMEGVEETQPASSGAAAETAAAGPTTRITTTIRGREVDITELGIDMEYLEALPDELREEVLMQQITERRSQAAASGEAPTDISPEFLEALPEDIRAEILQQEAADRRRRERDEARRRAATDGPSAAPRAEDMDAASFLASLDPGLRQAVLMDQDEEMLAQLPYEIAAEARALDHRRLNQYAYDSRFGRARPVDRNAQAEDQAHEKNKPRPVVQMFDKSGVATLLRLMFIPLQGSAKDSLREILVNVCKNRQNRAEVISILLNILQDGTTDVNAVERSFAQLSLRAKQPASQKTPQSSKKAANQVANLTDMSPLMVVQQCISTLSYLVHSPGSHMSSFFLSEHETPSSMKTRTKTKGKAKDSKASRYPLNALLNLLDRKIVIESSTVMEQLAVLLQMITSPLQALLKKDKEKEKAPETSEKGKESQDGNAENAQPGSEGAEQPQGDAQESTQQPTTAVAAEPAGAEDEDAPGSSSKKSDKAEDNAEDSAKKPRTLVPPEVPEENLRLVVNILAARECSSKTFRETLSVINNLSAIPGAKEIFGKELINQSLSLGSSILTDLGELVVQISSAKSGTDVQGMALSKFSPASSDQAKLLRVLTALDYLFDPKRIEASDKSTTTADGPSLTEKDDILTALFENPTFGSLWNKLSECLTAIRHRGNMFNIATILLPLIEILMVVCKNTTLIDMPLAKSHHKELSSLSSPQSESRMENFFFAFTEEHRKILNDLVRHNPKLMSGSFSLLVKNSKVLEFDNKRNYFNRRLHMRSSEVRQPHHPLQLSVRRDQVFLDSFKSLYFKTPEEMKYGKLSIRFHGEEGVDAGGVTREWFQVLSRQMFNPDYALFIPVASDRTTFHPNRLSAINQEHLMFFKFIGRIIGKALYEGRVLDCHFSRAVYKRILQKPVGIKDMESLDLDYYKSLVWMLENDITEVMTETFSVETEAFGETEIIDLIPDGRNVSVTEENKHEYVRLVVEYRLTGSVQEQLENFLKGFHDIIPADLVSIFNEQELELLISGLPDIDVDDWKNNTEYHNYTAASPQIQWFWRAVRSFDKEERAKLLQFVTGTSKVPLNGFKELEGMNGFSKFNIHRDYGHKDRLPSSHTCFNQLDLPEYPSYEKLREQLYTAMTAGSEYFGFA